MKTRMSDIPGASQLVKDYFDRFDDVARFYNGDYREPENFLARADTVRSRDLPSSELVSILKEQNQDFGCGHQTLANIDLLSEEKACAVVTGQQTGLFGGPLFTVYKALTAIKVSARLSRTCEACFLPVFWLASDDHDFREVNHISLLDKSNASQRIEYDHASSGSRVPVSEIPLKTTIEQTLQELAQSTHPSDFKQGILDELSAAYQPGTVFSDAFAKWMTALFRSFGLIFIDASDARIKRLGSHIFAQEISEDSPSTRAANKSSLELKKSHYHTQVQLHEGLLNLFYVDGQRRTLAIEHGTYAVKGGSQKFSKADLIDLVSRHAERFSPNVLLRPLYQDALLPTVAYIAGPAEGAYFAQMKGIYERFHLPMPIIYPRKSLTLLEGKIEKVLDKYGLRAQDFWGDTELLVNDIARSQLPEALEKRINNANLSVKQNLKALEDVVTEFDSTLKSTVENVRGRILNQMDGLEKKILQAYKKRNDVIRQQIHKAQHSLHPNHHLQERELNIVPYLFKYGFDFIDQLYEAIDITNFDHQIVKV